MSSRRRFRPSADNPPPGPFRREFWRSPIRGPWLTAVLGSALLLIFAVVAVTGFLSHAAYDPDLPGNSFTTEPGGFNIYFFDWPTSPSWLYALTQGLHVTLGLAAIPLLLAKLWSVMPKLFEWPPAASPAHAVERLGIALLVASSVLLLVTGVFNIQIYYPWSFSFLKVHYYTAFVFVGALVLHVGIKMPVAIRAYRDRGALGPLRDSVAATRPEPADASTSVAVQPAAPTITRRGVLGLAGGGALGLAVIGFGQTAASPLRDLGWLAPRGQSTGSGPNDFPVNKRAAAFGIGPAQTGPSWRLRLAGAREVELSRDQLLAMPQHTYDLQIACVEGWSTTQRWTGVRLRDLAELAGRPDARYVRVESIQERGSFRAATLNPGQIADDRSLLALKVNGADLSMDHGFPARIIVPALPGVHCTKWVAQMRFVA
jgi:DMSO/TMAO reductase YedYZ molybdopterin-dependent catalytic subunit